MRPWQCPPSPGLPLPRAPHNAPSFLSIVMTSHQARMTSHQARMTSLQSRTTSRFFMPHTIRAIQLTMVALLLCGTGRWGAAAEDDKTSQLRKRLVERLASRGLPLQEQRSAAEALLERLLPGSMRTENPWFPHTLDTTPQYSYGLFSSSRERELQESSQRLNLPYQSFARTNRSPGFPGAGDRARPALNEHQDELPSDAPIRSARQHPHHRTHSYQQRQLEHGNQTPSRNYRINRQDLSQRGQRDRLPARDSSRPSSVPREYPLLQSNSRDTRLGSEDDSPATEDGVLDEAAEQSAMEDLISRNIEEIIRSRINTSTLQITGAIRTSEIEARQSQGIVSAALSAPADIRQDESDLPGTQLIRSSSNAEGNDFETPDLVLESTTKRTETREERRARARERRRQRERKRKKNKRDKNRRNRDRNRKKDKKNKNTNNTNRNKRTKIEELIARESLILHEVDGKPFLDCCPSKLVVVEKQVGKARDKHAVELHPDSQFFYERVCMEEFEGSECIFPARALKPWVETRCAQTYSFSQALVRPYDSNEDWALDYIEVSSGCSCQVNVSPRGGSTDVDDSAGDILAAAGRRDAVTDEVDVDVTDTRDER